MCLRSIFKNLLSSCLKRIRVSVINVIQINFFLHWDFFILCKSRNFCGKEYFSIYLQLIFVRITKKKQKKQLLNDEKFYFTYLCQLAIQLLHIWPSINGKIVRTTENICGLISIFDNYILILLQSIQNGLCKGTQRARASNEEID